MRHLLTAIRALIIAIIAGAPVFIAWAMIEKGAKIPVLPEIPQGHNIAHVPGWVIIASQSLIIIAVVAAIISEWRNSRQNPRK